MATCPLCEGSKNSPLEDPYGDPLVDKPCPVCLGNGVINEVHGSFNGIEATVLVTLQLVKSMDTKLDSIIAEQASQRTDLTAALNQIWNKVKDL